MNIKTNTEINTDIDNQCELVISHKQIISLSSSISTTPKLSSTTPNFSEEINYEIELSKYHQEVRNLKYKIIDINREKNRIEEDNLYLLDEISSKNEKIVILQMENKKLNNEIIIEKDSHLKTKIIAFIYTIFSSLFIINK
jgi:hypothetical protein